MKKFFKTVLILVLLLVIGSGGYYVYMNYIRKVEQHDVFNVIPNNAIFVIETQNAPKAWDQFSQSDIWKHLSQNPNLAEIDSYVVYFEDILNTSAVNTLFHGGLENREVLLSAHMVGGKNYDFLYVLDMKNAPNILALTKALSFTGYEIKSRKFKGEKIIELHDTQSSDVIYLAVYDNLLLMSYVGNIIENALAKRLNDKWNTNPQFLKVSNAVRNTKLANFYLNFKQIPQFAACFTDENTDYLNELAKGLSFSALNLDINHRYLTFDGYTGVDTFPSYFSALSKVNPGKLRAYEILSDQTALYMSIGFENFNTFYNNLTSQYNADSPKDFEDIQANVNKVEKLLKINIKNDIFNWIGQEIAFVKLRPDEQTRMEDVVVAIHAKDMQSAKAGLSHVIKQVPGIKFKDDSYKNFPIQYLAMKGFFRIFLGKMFESLEKPYITYIEDYVVMSNSLPTLKKIIDDYTIGNTLAHNNKFMDFKDNFKGKSNASLFIQMPKLYTNLYHFSSAEDKKAVKENKDLILSFARIGLQLSSEDGIFRNYFLAEHDTSVFIDEKLEVIEKNTQDSSALIFALNHPILLGITDSLRLPNGPYKKYFDVERTQIQFEAMIEDSLLNGVAKLYYPDGKLQATLRFKNNRPDGELKFYFDNENELTPMLEAQFNDGKLEGEVREYYPTGARKSLVNYENNQLEGDAEYYYPTGSIKMAGEYRDSLKNGKWKFYDEKGNLISKKRFRKGK